jgi:hypothetical protein
MNPVSVMVSPQFNRFSTKSFPSKPAWFGAIGNAGLQDTAFANQTLISLRFKGEDKPPASPPNDKEASAKTETPAKKGRLKQWFYWGLIGIGCLPLAGQHLMKKDPIQMVQTVYRNTTPCPQKMRDTLSPFFNLEPYRINFDELQVVPEFSPGFKNRNHVIPGFTGTVVLNPKDYKAYLNFDQLSLKEQRRLTIIFAHELTHLIQIQILGRDAFLKRIAEESLTHKNVYDTQNELFQRVQIEKESQNKMNDITLFVHPHLTLEQSAVLVEEFVGKRF